MSEKKQIKTCERCKMKKDISEFYGTEKTCFDCKKNLGTRICECCDTRKKDDEFSGKTGKICFDCKIKNKLERKEAFARLKKIKIEKGICDFCKKEDHIFEFLHKKMCLNCQENALKHFESKIESDRKALSVELNCAKKIINARRTKELKIQDENSTVTTRTPNAEKNREMEFSNRYDEKEKRISVLHSQIRVQANAIKNRGGANHPASKNLVHVYLKLKKELEGALSEN